MVGLRDKIGHVVVLMLENRSFDCLLGKLRPPGAAFDGLAGGEFNPYKRPDGTFVRIESWRDPTLDAGDMTIPDPDPGESFDDINTQLFGPGGAGAGPASMSGFVDDYMGQKPADAAYDPKAPMHYYTPDQVPVISQLANAFAVCDQWYASAPCQTWPNRFFVHTGAAGGRVDNTVLAIPALKESIFHRLAQVGRTSRVYFHDVPQSLALADQWSVAAERFHPIDAFWTDADRGDLPDYAFIEPRYFALPGSRLLPNDQHPPHDVVYGEQLIANVYNAVRASPLWKKILFVLTYDEHGGCYDHAPPPRAAPPFAEAGADGFLFDRYGVRVPAVIVSPYIAPGTVLRNAPTGVQPEGGAAPFDHTSIIRTLRELFDPNGEPLTGRDASAPSLDLALNLDQPSNDGPDRIEPPLHVPHADEIDRAASLPTNDLQHSLRLLSAHLPSVGAGFPAPTGALPQGLPADLAAARESVADAADFVRSSVEAFLG